MPVKRKKLTSVYDLGFEKYDPAKDGITQTLTMTFLKCRRKFLYQVNGYSSPKRTKTTGFGSLFHDMLDNTYTFNRDTGLVPGRKRIREWIDEFVMNKRNLLLGKSRRELEKDRVVAYVLLTEYVKYYNNDFLSMKFKHVEKQFDIVWKGFRLRGKIDALFTLDGKLWIMEHKTKSRIDSEAILKALSFDFQTHFYAMVAEMVFDRPVAGVLYNVVRNPGVKEKESLEALESHLRKEIRKNPKHYFLRFEALLLDDMQLFRKELIVKLREIRKTVDGELPAFKCEAACFSGWNPCSFLDACASGNMQGYVHDPKLFKELEDE